MTNVSLGKKRVILGATILLVFAAVFAAPISTSAMTLLPAQILPAGTGKSCPSITLSEIRAHIYNGHLDSFDVSLPDPSYVAVATEVGGAAVDYRYISRWAYPDGSIKMHVDLQAMDMGADVPVRITFLSSQRDANGNQITCAFSIPATIPAVVQNTAGGLGGNQASGSGTQGQGSSQGGTEGEGEAGATTTNVLNPGIVAAMNSLGNLCADGGSVRLWVVLLILFALFTFTLSTQRFEPNSSVRDWNIGLILAVFAGLLVFWYTSALCRAGPWAPAFATIITIIGLLYSMLKADDAREILLLKDGKK